MHGCEHFKWPKSNTDYWEPKLKHNAERDIANQNKLVEDGWNVIVVWECELKKEHFEQTMYKLVNEIKHYQP